MSEPTSQHPTTPGPTSDRSDSSPLSHPTDLAWYALLGIALALSCHLLIPDLRGEPLSLAPRMAWFIAASPIFIAMFVITWCIIASERRSSPSAPALRRRLRLTRLGPSQRRWLWLGLGLAGLGISAVYGGSHGLAAITGWDVAIDPAPSFLHAPPLSGAGWWVMLAWPPFFFLNIVGEELLWRGALLPRHEAAFGRHAWLVNATGWLLFHTAFGFGLVAMVAPMIFAQCWVCQRSGSTTVGIALHALINGPGFLAGTLVAM